MSVLRWVFAIALVSGVATACTQELTPQEMLQQGQQELKAGQRADARKHLEQGLATLDDESAYIVLAQLMLSEGQLDQAGALLARATEAFPRNAALRALQGELWAGQGQVDKAVAAYRRACELNSTDLGLLLRWAALNTDGAVAISLERMLQSRIRARPNAETLIVQADVLRQAGQADRARQVLAALEGAELGQADQAAALGRLMLLRASPGLDGAERLLRLASADDKATVDLLALHAQVALDLGRYGVAQKSLSRAEQLWPEGRAPGASFQLLLGRLALETGNTSRAAEILEPLLGKVSKEHTGLHKSALGRALMQLDERIEEGKKLLSEVPAGTPGYAEAQVALATSAVADSDPSTARELLTGLLNLQPRYEAAYGMLAALQSQQGQGAASRKTLERGVVMIPDSALLWYELGRQSLASDPVRAAAELGRSVDLAPTLLSARPVLAEALLRSGRGQKAVQLYEDGLRLAPDTLPWMNNLAVLYADRGERLERAKELAERAYAMGEKAPALADTLGWVLARSGEYAAAGPLIEAAAEAMPDDGEVLMHLAYNLASLGQKKDAAKTLKRARSAAADKPRLLTKISQLGQP